MLKKLGQRFVPVLVTLSFLSLALVACGDNTATTDLSRAQPSLTTGAQPSVSTLVASTATKAPTATVAAATTAPATATVAATPAATTAATGAGTVDAPIGTPFQLKYQQTALLKPENVGLTFTIIGTDSRCPRSDDPAKGQVACVTDGQVEVWLEARKDGQFLDSLKLLRRGSDYPTPVPAEIKSVANYAVQLLKVEPYPTINKPKPPASDYVITLLVSKKG